MTLLPPLESYYVNALKNAHDLLNESKLLFDNKYYARAYFLSCLSIEETGKTYIAFSAQERNLKNQGIHKTLNDAFKRHPSKMIAAFSCFIMTSKASEKSIRYVLDSVHHIKIGREASMYVDVTLDNTVTLPSEIVRPSSASACIKLAEDCFNTTKKFISNNRPYKTTSYEDKLLCMDAKIFSSIFSTQDFYVYYLEAIKKCSCPQDFIKYIVTYHDAYFRKNKKYQVTDNKSLKGTR